MYPKSAVYFPFNRVPAVFQNNGFTDDELMKLFTSFVTVTDGNTSEDRKELLNNKYYIEQISNGFNYCKAQDKKHNTPKPIQQYAQLFVNSFFQYIQQGLLCKDAFQKALKDVKNQRHNNQTHSAFTLGTTIKTENNILHAPKPLEMHAFALYLRRQFEASQAAVPDNQIQQVVSSLLDLSNKK